MSRPLASIIIPNRNHASWLKACVESCLSQSYPDLEILVVDDASGDSSPGVARSFGPPVRLVTLPARSGPGAARNEGFRHARGEFIQFLDADDFIAPGKILLQAEALARDRTDLCVCDWKTVFTVAGRPFPGPDEKAGNPRLLLQETARDRGWVPVSCFLLRRDLVERTGPWNEELPWNEDREYRYRLLLERPRISYTAKTLFYYRYHTGPSHSKRFYEPARSCERLAVDRHYATRLMEDFEAGLLRSRGEREAVRAFIEGHIQSMRDSQDAGLERLRACAERIYPEAPPGCAGEGWKRRLCGALRRVHRKVILRVLRYELSEKAGSGELFRGWLLAWYRHFALRFADLLERGTAPRSRRLPANAPPEETGTALPDFQTETIAMRDLEEFAEREAARKNGLVAVTRSRARSQSRNPLASAEDPALILVHRGDTPAGYLGLMPGMFYDGRKSVKVYWASTAKAAEEFRGMGVADALLRHAQRDCDAICANGVSASGAKALRRNGFTAVERRHLVRLDLDSFRIPFRRTCKSGLLRRTGGASLAWVRAFARFFPPRLEVTECAGVSPSLEEKLRPSPGFFRNADVIRWMMETPWWPGVPAPNETERRYHFHRGAKAIRFRSFEFRDRGILRGFAVFSVIEDGEITVKLLDHAFDDAAAADAIGRLALRLAAEERASALLLTRGVYLRTRLRWLPFPRRRPAQTYFFWAKERSLLEKLAAAEASSTDGDTAFW